MTRQEKLDKVLTHMANVMDVVPTRPDLICKNAGLKVDEAEAYSMLDMMCNDGYVGTSAPEKSTYTIRYKGIIFMDNGGYSLEHKHYKRQQRAQKISDYVDMLVKPTAILTAISVFGHYMIQILTFFGCM